MVNPNNAAANDRAIARFIALPPKGCLSFDAARGREDRSWVSLMMTGRWQTVTNMSSEKFAVLPVAEPARVELHGGGNYLLAPGSCRRFPDFLQSHYIP